MPPSYEHVRSGHSISPITPNGFCYRRTVHALHPTRMTAYVSFAGIHRQEVYRDAIAAASVCLSGSCPHETPTQVQEPHPTNILLELQIDTYDDNEASFKVP
jgi:hypothetical protein